MHAGTGVPSTTVGVNSQLRMATVAASSTCLHGAFRVQTLSTLPDGPIRASWTETVPRQSFGHWAGRSGLASRSFLGSVTFGLVPLAPNRTGVIPNSRWDSRSQSLVEGGRSASDHASGIRTTAAAAARPLVVKRRRMLRLPTFGFRRPQNALVCRLDNWIAHACMPEYRISLRRPGEVEL